MRAHANHESLATYREKRVDILWKRPLQDSYKNPVTRIPGVSDIVGFVDHTLLYQTLYSEFHFTSRRPRYGHRLLSIILTRQSILVCTHSLCDDDLFSLYGSSWLSPLASTSLHSSEHIYALCLLNIGWIQGYLTTFWKRFSWAAPVCGNGQTLPENIFGNKIG